MDYKEINEMIEKRGRENPVWAYVWDSKKSDEKKIIVGVSYDGSCIAIISDKEIEYKRGNNVRHWAYEHYELIPEKKKRDMTWQELWERKAAFIRNAKDLSKAPSPFDIYKYTQGYYKNDICEWCAMDEMGLGVWHSFEIEE